MDALAQGLLEVLNLETLEQNLFRGPSRNLGGRSMYGGQIIGQSLRHFRHDMGRGGRHQDKIRRTRQLDMPHLRLFGQVKQLCIDLRPRKGGN